MKIILKTTLFILLAGAMFHISCKKEYSCGYCRLANKPPIANAGSDIVILLLPGSYALDGSASGDPDGIINSYKWVMVAGPGLPVITQPDSSKTLAKALLPGVYAFELTAWDNGGLAANDTVQVVVNPSQLNQPPVANAGADQTIVLPTNTVTMDGGGSADPDNNISAYRWTKISGPSLFSCNNVNAIRAPVTNLIQGEYRFELTVTNSGGLSSKDTMYVFVVENLRGYEVVYNSVWGCNDLCRDGDVYWDSSPWDDHLYSDPNIPLEVSIRLDTTSAWIGLHKVDSPLPSINQFYWHIDRGGMGICI